MSMAADEIVQVLLRERLRVAAVAAAIVKDVHTADDVFQQVVLLALEDRDQFSDASHVLAWALRAARHRAIDITRRRQVYSLPEEVLDQLESQWMEWDSAEWSERTEALHHCIERLSSRSQELLQMKYAEGLTASVIAVELRRSLDAVYQSLSRIYRALRSCVQREMDREEALGRGESCEPTSGRQAGRVVRAVLGQRPDRRRSQSIRRSADGRRGSP